MAIEYLGNKRRLLDFVTGPIAQVRGLDSIADLFCGTASVSGALRAQGLRVVANDHMRLCATLAEAALLADGSPDGYVSRVAALNALEPEPGFFHRTYSPAGGRMYLTEANAAKIDAVRAQIAAWDLDRADNAKLLRDLVVAVTAVSNTAGTYGCYLKTWKRRALAPLTLDARVGHRRSGRRSAMRRRRDGRRGAQDGRRLSRSALHQAPIRCLLPPARDAGERDHPGRRGLHRTPSVAQSDFCYKRRAPGALARLLARLDVPHVFLSYSDDGHIPHEQILEFFGARGRVGWWELPSPRYRSSALEHKSSSVRERLYHLAAA